MPFPYYRRLSPANRAIYRRSAAICSLRVPEAEPIFAEIEALAAGLEASARGPNSAGPRAVAAASARILAKITAQLEAPPVDEVRVLAVRPSDAESELHGLYERDEDGNTTISVWMRTAAQGRVVAFRTFLRTLLHELCHHLDYEFYELEDSYHTEGFFARESSLMRQLAPSPKQARAVELAPSPEQTQLELPW